MGSLCPGSDSESPRSFADMQAAGCRSVEVEFRICIAPPVIPRLNRARSRFREVE